MGALNFDTLVSIAETPLMFWPLMFLLGLGGIGGTLLGFVSDEPMLWVWSVPAAFLFVVGWVAFFSA